MFSIQTSKVIFKLTAFTRLKNEPVFARLIQRISDNVKLCVVFPNKATDNHN